MDYLLIIQIIYLQSFIFTWHGNSRGNALESDDPGTYKTKSNCINALGGSAQKIVQQKKAHIAARLYKKMKIY
jgi:hypothetical protein